MDDLSKALSGIGPALAFCKSKSALVPEPISIVVATSGSNGPPKEVALTSNALLYSARASNKFLNAKFGDTWSLLLPLNHIAGINVLLRSLELGTATIDLRNSATYPKVDFTAIVPTQLFRALHGDTELLSHLQSCQAVLVGGAALTDDLGALATSAKINLVTTYGMTETCGGCVYNGTKFDGVDVEIREGQIAIKGAMLASNYLNDEPAWRKNFVDGWFITQDIGSIESGKLIVKNRADDTILTGGEKVSLFAVSEILQNKFPGHTFAAFGMADPEWGTALFLAIGGDAGPSDDEIALQLSNSLGVEAKPKGILRLAQLPLTTIGKLDRAALIEFASNQKGAL